MWESVLVLSVVIKHLLIVWIRPRFIYSVLIPQISESDVTQSHRCRGGVMAKRKWVILGDETWHESIGRTEVSDWKLKCEDVKGRVPYFGKHICSLSTKLLEVNNDLWHDHVKVSPGNQLWAASVCSDCVQKSCQHSEVARFSAIMSVQRRNHGNTLRVQHDQHLCFFLKLLLFLVLFLCLLFLKAPVCRIQEDLLAEVEYDVDHFDFITV